MRRWVWLSAVVILVVLLAHAFGGHAHADPLSAVPLGDHSPGDGHHEVSAPCDAVKSPARAAAPLPHVAGTIVVILPSEQQPWRLAAPAPSPDSSPPLFPRHSVLRI